jgi:hypothetical protein
MVARGKPFRKTALVWKKRTFAEFMKTFNSSLLKNIKIRKQ